VAIGFDRVEADASTLTKTNDQAIKSSTLLSSNSSPFLSTPTPFCRPQPLFDPNPFLTPTPFCRPQPLFDLNPVDLSTGSTGSAGGTGYRTMFSSKINMKKVSAFLLIYVLPLLSPLMSLANRLDNSIEHVRSWAPPLKPRPLGVWQEPC